MGIKLIIQIPCLNEEATLPVTYPALPTKIDGVDIIETLVINDGSTDRTAEVARKLGVDHILSFTAHRGLASAFARGLEKCLDLGADIIVNTDADNQYRGDDIPKLIRPILDGRADMVVGDRPVGDTPHFSRRKKILQRLGSLVTRKLGKVEVRDATSGFRAFSREAALRLNILTEYSYTLESLIQLGNKKLKIVSIPIQTNGQLRKSRLMKHSFHYVTSQMSTILRVYTAFKSLRVFTLIGLLIGLLGCLGMARFFYFLLIHHNGGGHIQSLVLSTTFLITGFFIVLIGMIADLIAANRKLIEMALYKIKNIELILGKPAQDEDRPR
jgi:glycosyltransferase involved in cell wall biosynthesis